MTRRFGSARRPGAGRAAAGRFWTSRTRTRRSPLLPGLAVARPIGGCATRACSRFMPSLRYGWRLGTAGHYRVCNANSQICAKRREATRAASDHVPIEKAQLQSPDNTPSRLSPPRLSRTSVRATGRAVGRSSGQSGAPAAEAAQADSGAWCQPLRDRRSSHGVAFTMALGVLPMIPVIALTTA